PGVSAPLKTISDNDMGALIAIIAAFSIPVVLKLLSIRGYSRLKLSTYKIDDFTFIGAVAFAIPQVSSVFYALKEGLGKTLELVENSSYERIAKVALTTLYPVLAGDILHILALLLSKCSKAFLLLRLTPLRGHFYALWCTISTSKIWGVASIILMGICCHPQHPWTDVFSFAECPSLITRWQFVAILDSLTELSLFGMSIYLVWGIKIGPRSKIIVVGAFGFRLPVVAIACLWLIYLDISLISAKPTLHFHNVVTCTQLEIGYSISASMIPCLKTFI
ncbi:hypothetical protein B0O99DRAFT_493305, partial [Bisporella sp. PMI_857]